MRARQTHYYRQTFGGAEKNRKKKICGCTFAITKKGMMPMDNPNENHVIPAKTKGA